MNPSTSNALHRIAEEMLIAAKTAPKARGIDNLIGEILSSEQKEIVINKMIEMGNATNTPFFIRDANNIKQCSTILLLGTYLKPIGLQDICGLCGFKNCTEKDAYPNISCIYNTNDLGIAIGSAVSIAMDKRVDNRVMFSIGQAAKQLHFFGDAPQILFGIPLSATSKNIFFDRK